MKILLLCAHRRSLKAWKGAESEDSLFTGSSRPSGMAQGSKTLHTLGWKGDGGSAR